MRPTDIARSARDKLKDPFWLPGYHGIPPWGRAMVQHSTHQCWRRTLARLATLYAAEQGGHG